MCVRKRLCVADGCLQASPHVDEVTLEELSARFESESDDLCLTAIRLPSLRLDADAAALLGVLAMRCSALRVLALAGNRVGDSGATSLAESLQHLPTRNLVNLDLSDNGITAAGAATLARGYAAHLWGRPRRNNCNACDGQGAAMLDLSGNIIGDDGACGLAKVFESALGSTSQQRAPSSPPLGLRLRKVRCTARGLESLLRLDYMLGELDVGQNPLGARGVEHLCGAVCRGRRWRALGCADLLDPASPSASSSSRPWRRRALPTSPGIVRGADAAARWRGLEAPLLRCAQAAPALRELSCGGVVYGDAAGARLAEALQEREPHALIERLALGASSCGLKTSRALALLLTLAGTLLQAPANSGPGRPGGPVAGVVCGLRVLALPNNGLDDECAAALAEGISGSLHLEDLDLADNRIRCAGATALANAIAAQRSRAAERASLPTRRCPHRCRRGAPGCVVALNLSGNAALGDDGAEALAVAASASAGESGARNLQVPWGLERLDLTKTSIGSRGCGLLQGAVAARAALADAAAEGVTAALACDDGVSVVERLRARSLRLPTGLKVLGLDLDDGVADAMRIAALARLRELLPDNQSPDETATCRGDDKCSCAVGNGQEGDGGMDEAVADALIPCCGLPDTGGDGACALESQPFLCVDDNHFGTTKPADWRSIFSPGGDESAARAAAPPPLPKGVPSPSPGGKGKGKAPLPPAEGGGKGKGGKKPPPPKRGAGPPPKAGKAGGFLGKGGASSAIAGRPVLGDAPFGRRIHWVQPTYEAEGASVFHERGDKGLEFDHSLLDIAFESPRGGKQQAVRRKKTLTAKPAGVTILDAGRAQNIAIVLSKLRISPGELCDVLRARNFVRECSLIGNEDVELLGIALPTKEEIEKLLPYQQSVGELRDVERLIMPFCLLPRSSALLRLMTIHMCHESAYAGLLERCLALRLAAEETAGSAHLRSVLAIVVRMGNYINHGVKDLQDGVVRGFAVESLSVLAAFKVRARLTAAHYICLTMRRADAAFFSDLRAGLSHVHAAAREKSGLLTAAVASFRQDAKVAEAELQLMGPSDEGREHIQALAEAMKAQSAELDEELRLALEKAAEAQKYFGLPAKSLPPCEEFFRHIASFLDALDAAWSELERQPPECWQHIVPRGGGEKGATKQGAKHGGESKEEKLDAVATDVAAEAPSQAVVAQFESARRSVLGPPAGGARRHSEASTPPGDGPGPEGAQAGLQGAAAPTGLGAGASSLPAAAASVVDAFELELDIDDLVDGIFGGLEGLGADDPDPDPMLELSSPHVAAPQVAATEEVAAMPTAGVVDAEGDGAS